LVPLRYQLLLNSYRKISYHFGSLLLVLSGLLITPLLLLVFDSRELADAHAFLLPALFALLLYLLFNRLLGKKEDNALSYEEAAVVICSVWIVMCIISALPFMKLTRMTFSQSFFEAMSGYTTTGLTMIDYSQTTRLLFLWRSIMQYAGGAGIAVFLIALSNSIYGSGLTSAEGKADLLVPQIKRSTRLVMLIYGSYALVAFPAYRIVGMGWFDAINHTFAALSTGGFSTYPESLAHWHSIRIEALTLVLMFLGNLNFLNAYLLFSGKVSAFLNNGEIKVQALIVPVATALVMLGTTVPLYGTLPHGFRTALFESVSALTTTGLTTTTYGNWNHYGLFILMLLMLIGGGSNSTAGGFKQYRLYLLWKVIIRQLKLMTSARNRMVNTSYWWGEQKRYITSETSNLLFLFLTLYFVIFAIGVAAMLAYGYSFTDALFEFTSTLSNSGLSTGKTGAAIPVLLIWLQTVTMYLGRLEILIIFVAIAKVYRDIKKTII